MYTYRQGGKAGAGQLKCCGRGHGSQGVRKALEQSDIWRWNGSPAIELLPDEFRYHKRVIAGANADTA